MPIAGYNYGAEKFQRVRESINTSITYGGILAIIIFLIIMVFPHQFISIFVSTKTSLDPETLANNKEILQRTPSALRIVFFSYSCNHSAVNWFRLFPIYWKSSSCFIIKLNKTRFFSDPTYPNPTSFSWCSRCMDCFSNC